MRSTTGSASIRDLIRSLVEEKIAFRVSKSRGALHATARAGGKKVGQLIAVEQLSYYSVDKVGVLDDFQRKGIASELYQRVAKKACQLGKPLRSMDYQRSPDAGKVWAKEMAAGRALKGEDHKGSFFYYPCKP